MNNDSVPKPNQKAVFDRHKGEHSSKNNVWEKGVQIFLKYMDKYMEGSKYFEMNGPGGT